MSTRPSWMIPAVCIACGADFFARKYDVASGIGKFCSKKCRYATVNRPGHGHPCWKGGRHLTWHGYVNVSTGKGRPNLEHIVVAERALGKSLPRGAEVHHVNGRKDDNRPQNLVICQNAAYHQFLHSLQRIRARGGRPFIDRYCSICKAIKPITAFSPSEYRCKPCNAARGARYGMQQRQALRRSA